MTQKIWPPASRGRSRINSVLAGGGLLALALPATAYANPQAGTYFCDLGTASFYLSIDGGGGCATYLPVLVPRRTCTYSYNSGNRLLTFSDNAQPELRIYTVYFLPADARGSRDGRIGPGFEAFNERSLEGPPTNAGWCSPSQ